MAVMDNVTSTTDRLDALIEEQEQQFVEGQPRSAAMVERAVGSLAGGATSSWMVAKPQTVWVSHGAGSKLYDIDGREYVDLHGGYGVMAVGHAHPEVVEAVRARVGLGTHFAQPTEDAVVVAEELVRRFRQPLWRFCNSGTEATMDAVHLMRAATGRDLIVKVEGSYHGHHDAVMVSLYNDEDEIGPADAPIAVAAGNGIPQAMVDITRIVPFNDLDVLEQVLAANEGRVAGMIMEPAMMNIGIVPPEPGYLEGVRELTRRHGVLLAFDEVKTGLTIAPGGATEVFGVTPDIICLAKALGGGLPCGAIGGSEEVMGNIVRGVYDQVGTFNGNPLTMAAARAVLTRILTPEAYTHLDGLGSKMLDGALGLLGEHGVPSYGQCFGAKGCVVFSATPVRNYREFLAIDNRISHLHWLFQANGGVFLPPWGKSEQWTLSVQHTDADADRFLDNVTRFAPAVEAATS